MATARRLYKSYLFVAGATLLVLGLGNYLAAVFKVDHYQEAMAEIAPQVRVADSFAPNEERHYFPSDARERWEIARAKLDFYRVVLDVGRFMVGIGALCSAIALLHLRRQSARLVHLPVART